MTHVLGPAVPHLGLWLSLAGLSTDAFAQQSGPRPLTRLDLERFADSALARYVRESAAPSLAVVVIRGDSVLLSKGYGRADDSTPVSVDSTVYHIASLSKLFVVTAVMQQVERGQLLLDAAVAAILPEFAIPRDVTLRHLLTHTSGVDAPFLADVVDRASELQSLSTYFSAHPPRFGRPPGREIRYSNYGMALAALVVERATGEPFDAYVERHMFAPLQMRSTAIRQPPPPAIEGRMATAGSGRVPNYLLVYPAGAIVSTAADMGRFMRAMLTGGNDGTPFLTTRSRSEIERRQWAAHPAIPGVALGFFESDMGGVRALFHTGARTHFSLIYLLPEQEVGVFIVHSMRQSGPFQSLRADFARAFVERYFRPVVPADSQGDSTPRAQGVAGTYRPVLFSRSTLERAAWLFTDTKVVANADGSLSLHLPASPELRLVPSDGAFRVLHGEQRGLAVAFGGNAESGRRMFLSGATQDPITFDRLAWYERGTLHLVLLAIAYVVVAGYSIVALPLATWRLLRRRVRPVLSAAEVRANRMILAPSVLLTMGPLGVLAVLLTRSGSGGPRLALATGTTFVLCGAVLSLGSVPLALVAWRRSYWNLARRIYIAVFAVSSILAVALLMYYHVGPIWL